LFFGFLTTSVALFAVAAWLTIGQTGTLDWSLTLARFLLLAGALGSAIAAWATAVSIAYVHRVTWPFLLMTGLIVTAGLTFAIVRLRAA
jgi:hypothetical protein